MAEELRRQRPPCLHVRLVRLSEQRVAERERLLDIGQQPRRRHTDAHLPRPRLERHQLVDEGEYVSVAAALSAWFARPNVRKRWDRATGGVLAGLGGALATTKL
ncbi:hypothetical protein [Aeromicrobium sp. Root344]|uniref:hypothetical protein n=1 Tax=Aeromicrobium sp. Root344 TaxID=1736521 RepID=UPI0012FABAC0|nr:hypothetical protein [Aeromicrobium sp. Root344]